VGYGQLSGRSFGNVVDDYARVRYGFGLDWPSVPAGSGNSRSGSRARVHKMGRTRSRPTTMDGIVKRKREKMVENAGLVRNDGTRSLRRARYYVPTTGACTIMRVCMETTTTGARPSGGDGDYSSWPGTGGGPRVRINTVDNKRD